MDEPFDLEANQSIKRRVVMVQVDVDEKHEDPNHTNLAKVDTSV